MFWDGSPCKRIYYVRTQITKFMGPTWGPPGSCRPQMGPMLAPWTSLSGYILRDIWQMEHRITSITIKRFPDSKAYGANMGPIWGRQDPGGPHIGPMNFAIWVEYLTEVSNLRMEMCTFLFRMEHCGIWNRCILGFMKLVYWGNSQCKYDGFAGVVYEILRWMSYHTSKSVQYFTVTSQYGYHFYFQSQSLSLSLSIYIYIYIYIYMNIYKPYPAI